MAHRRQVHGKALARALDGVKLPRMHVRGVHSKYDARVPCKADAHQSDGLGDRFGIARELCEQCGERHDHAQDALRGGERHPQPLTAQS